MRTNQIAIGNPIEQNELKIDTSKFQPGMIYYLHYIVRSKDDKTVKDPIVSSVFSIAEAGTVAPKSDGSRTVVTAGIAALGAMFAMLNM